MDISLKSIDVGFDLRTLNIPVYLPIPLKGDHKIQYDGKSGSETTCGKIEVVSETLARAGFNVVPCLTANGRDVRCSLKEDRPNGKGDLLTDIAWSVQSKNDNIWHSAFTLHAALARADWTEHDLIQVESLSPKKNNRKYEK